MESETERGMSVFLDVFRRADKNDDNCLSLEEFKSFFSDGILKDAELEELFHKIDTHNTNNIDTGELCAYFSAHLGPFREIFGALQELSLGVSKTLQHTAEEYPKKPFFDQFTTRFLLKEVRNQLAAVQHSLETAEEHLEEDALKDRPKESHPVNIQAQSDKPSLPGWVGRRARRQFSTQTSIPADGLSSLTSQIDRLQSLVDKLEQKMQFTVADEEQVADEDDDLSVIVAHKLRVKEDQMANFRDQLRSYIEKSNQDKDCVNVCVRAVRKSNQFSLFEVWSSPEARQRHSESTLYLGFLENLKSTLDGDLSTSEFKVPSKWIPDE